MSRIKSRETSIEVKLRKVLWQRGYRYQKNCKDIYGKPDICFKGKKVAIFCDSEFWHGKLYREGRAMPKSNQEYWIPKLERNIERDKIVTEKLISSGWTVLRFWESEIKKDIEKVLNEILIHLLN